MKIEGGCRSTFAALRAALLALLLTGVVVSGCADGEAGAQTDEVADVFDEVWAAVDEGDLETICEHLGDNGRRQVLDIGHVPPPTCEAGLRELVSGARAVGIRRDRPGPELLDLEVTTSAVARVKIDGRETEVPLVREDGRWKLDAMFGVGVQESTLR